MDVSDKVRVGVRAALTAGLTQALIAKESGVSATTLSQWLADQYPGDNDAVAVKVKRWLDARQAREEEQRRMPAAPDFVSTPTAERVLVALQYAQMAADITVIYGGAGLGKTSAIRHYATVSPQVWVATMTPASASVVTCLEEICEQIGIAYSGGASRLHRAILKKISGTGGLLVIDEAQHLSVAALDQLRSIHDATGIGLALVGNESVFTRMSGGQRAAYLDRLFSRIGKRVSLNGASKQDVRAIAGAWGMGDDCRKALEGIAALPGALRGVTKAIRLATATASAAGRPVCCDDVRSAWRELGGAA
jgi:DNA transposition AAA+ family ATPase